MRDHEDDGCEVFDPNLVDGVPMDLGIKATFEVLPPRIEDFVGRIREFQEIVQNIQDHKFISIVGVQGIGKSAILKEVCHFVHDRRLYQDGSIYMNLVDCNSTDDFLENLFEILEIKGDD
jgi:Cdc6-like AAA superfamily ATPase